MILTLRLLRSPQKEYAIVEKNRSDEPDMVISLRKNGDMSGKSPEGETNRLRLFAALNIHADRVFSLHQVHSKNVLFTKGSLPMNSEGDGMVAAEQKNILAVTVADCMPIYIFDRKSRHFAIVHSGWKGTGIAAQAVRLLCSRFGCDPAGITAVLGPSIRGCCYAVDGERAENFGGRWGKASVRWETGTDGRKQAFLDLAAANRKVLSESGVRDVREIDECTVCSPDFGSFRREGPAEFTHMLAMIGFFK